MSNSVEISSDTETFDGAEGRAEAAHPSITISRLGVDTVSAILARPIAEFAR